VNAKMNSNLTLRDWIRRSCRRWKQRQMVVAMGKATNFHSWYCSPESWKERACVAAFALVSHKLSTLQHFIQVNIHISRIYIKALMMGQIPSFMHIHGD
jgi:hypothetical protein